MAEFTGLAYYAEIPAVIFDIQRVGPSTGLPTRTAQEDIAFAAGLSHGDCRARPPAARRPSPSATRWRRTPSTSPSACRRPSS